MFKLNFLVLVFGIYFDIKRNFCVVECFGLIAVLRGCEQKNIYYEFHVNKRELPRYIFIPLNLPNEG